AAGRTPDEIARLALALAAHERTLEHVGLLDAHVLVVGQARPRREFHERGHQPGFRIGEQRLALDAGEARLFPGQRRDIDEARGERGQACVQCGVRCACVHGIVKWKVAPWSGCAMAQILPLWRRTILAASASPTPVPSKRSSRCRRSNMPKSLPACCMSKPTPLSRTK